MSEDRINKAIPHRKPFLFADTVLSSDEKGIRTKRKILGDEYFFEGHYPSHPIMPGVLLLECVFQAGAIWISEHCQAQLNQGAMPVVTRVNNVKFRRMVKPNDELEICASLVEQKSGVFFMQGFVELSGKKIVSVDFACTLVAGESI